MTSQHFDDGWDNWGEDWGGNHNNESNNNNNPNSQQLSQQNQQFVQQPPQQPPQMTANAPLYSPFSYQQPPQAVHNPTTQQQNPFAKSVNQTPTQQHSNQQYANPVNFFNPTQYSDGNANNNNNINNNMSPFGSNQPASYSFVQSPIPSSTVTSSLNPQNSPFEKVKNFQHQDVARRDSNSSIPNVNQNPVQYAVPPSQQNNMPQSNANFLNDQKATQALPTQPIYNNNHHDLSQSRSMATPPTMMQNYDTNFNSTATTTQHSGYQYSSQWTDQRTQSNESANNVSNWQTAAPTSQNSYMPSNNNNNNLQMPPIPPTNSEWQNLQAPPISQPPSNIQHPAPPLNQPMMPSSAGYFQNHFEVPPVSEEKPAQIQEHPKVSNIPQPAPTSNQTFQPPPQPPKFENVENVQTPVSEHLPSSSSSMVHGFKNPIPEVPYPENRERLDDLASTSTPPVLPPPPSISQPLISPSIVQQSIPHMPTSSAPSIDRHNYLVTGQLSQEFPAFNASVNNQQQNVMHESFNENLPPPGLSRMVVGEPENNQEQVIQAPQVDLLPPRSNRMVTGTEMTPTSFMNYQRQADGEVSHETSMQRTLPPFSTANQQLPIQNQPQGHAGEEQQQPQQNFNISDRNLYLVAGESDANSQRVITGVESDNSNAPINLINPLQNLHIEDDEDFVNISVTQMSRNVDGDGMEEEHVPVQQHALDNSQQREEEIEGANDNNNQPAIEVLPIPPPPPMSEQNSDIREDIEGGNDSSEPSKPPPADLDEKRKSIDSGMRSQHKQNVTMSSEDSELRELEKNMKSKAARRSKKYNDSNDSESASVDEYKEKSRDRYDDRYSKKNRDRVRDEYEKYKKGRERRSGGGRSRRNDDTDGSRYGDTKRRTDDEDEDRRRSKNRNKNREDDNDVDEKDRDRKDRRHRDPRDSRRKDYDYDERRRDRRRRDKYYDDEGYPSGRRSHNASDREYDRDYRPGRSSRGPYEMQGYYQQPGYPYDPNYYYQQQYSDKLNNWLEQIRLTNPQAYEWYKNYYSGILQKPQMPPQPAMDDIGGSLRSGYNSGSERASTSRFISGGMVTNPLGSLNSSFIDNTNVYQSLQPGIGKDFNLSYSSLNYNNYDMYGDSRAKATEEIAAGRMTPQKFQCLHGYVRLANGLMITVDTLNADDKYSVRIENVPIHDKTRKLYQSYPGPLIRGVSHKKTVIEFCEDQLKNNSQLESSLRSSYALLWSYLILMIRQNGSYTEHDIAELLMKNYEEYRSYDMDVDNNKSSTNNINSNNDDDENATDVSESDENVTSEHNSNSASQSHQVTQSASILTENVVLDKFKSYLLYGNIHDALDYATDNNLWGHALFLASKVDRRQHANVMLKFANKLSYNDPLQTLYQIMSGRMPACVTNFDDKWGDWRPHLAMIISNCPDKPDLVKQSVLALGDTLASRGDVYGSQFCYLLIDPQFTDYSDTMMTNGKLALLGTTVQKPFNEFASNDSIIMTEVYEYARSLSAENYFVTSLQKYKFLLATNMLDYGMKLKCLLYMEQISKCIIQQPEIFDGSFVTKVYSLADRLKFYDPVMEKLYEDTVSSADGTEDQKWLQDLALVLQNNSGLSVTEQYAPQVPTYSNDVYNPLDYQQTQPVQQIYDPVSQHQTPTHVPTLPSQVSYEEHDSQQYNNSYEQQSQVPVQSYDQNAAFNQYQQVQDQQLNYQYGQMPNENQQSLLQNSEPQQSQQQNNYMQPNYDPNAQYQQNEYGGYGWDQPKPNITMGAAVSHKYDEAPSQEKTEKEATSKDEKKSPAKKAEAEKSKKPAQPNPGWFSRLFGKAPNQMILPDDKNPSIVWDEATKKWVNKDEDPAEAESFKPPPKMGEMGMPQPMQNIPQSMPQPQQIPQQPQQPIQNMQQPQQPIQNMQQTQQPIQNMQQQPQQFMPQTQQPVMQQQQQQPMMSQNPMQNHVAQPSQQQQQQQVGQNATEEAVPAVPSAPNMFKMQKGRNLKKSYVDILGNAGKTVSQPKELAPQMDMQFFNPTAQPQGMQFYNPNDFQ